MNNQQTPSYLGERLAVQGLTLLGHHLSRPESMLSSDSFESFCRGRDFTETERRECEDAYKRHWKELQ